MVEAKGAYGNTPLFGLNNHGRMPYAPSQRIGQNFDQGYKLPCKKCSYQYDVLSNNHCYQFLKIPYLFNIL
jgi:hypothetical protein